MGMCLRVCARLRPFVGGPRVWCACVYVCMCVPMRVCICFSCECLCECACLCVFLCVSARVRVCTCLYASIYAWQRTRGVYACVHVVHPAAMCTHRLNGHTKSSLSCYLQR